MIYRAMEFIPNTGPKTVRLYSDDQSGAPMVLLAEFQTAGVPIYNALVRVLKLTGDELWVLDKGEGEWKLAI